MRMAYGWISILLVSMRTLFGCPSIALCFVFRKAHAKGLLDYRTNEN